MTDEVTTAEGLSDPTLSYGLMGINDWSTQMPFIDITKSMRPWLGHMDGGWGGMTYDELLEGGYLDENGWPTEIPEGVDAIGTIWAWSSSMEGAESREGVYVLTYEGEGSIKVNGPGVNIISSEPGKIVFENTTGEQLTMGITETDPNGNGEYIRDVAIVHEDNLELYEAGAMFDPDFLDIVDDARQLRFLDWASTNDTNQESWDDRPQVDDAFWTTDGGVPIEIMVQLANELGTDPWFTIPHTADDEYIREMAEYVAEHLDPELTAYVEFSNEAWNSTFEVYTWLHQKSYEEWGEKAPFDYYAKRATETAVIWEEAFANQEGASELVNVMGSHNAKHQTSESQLEASLWLKYEPDAYIDPASVFDALAITTYFGGATMSEEEYREELLDAINDPDIDANAYLYDKLANDPDYKWSIPFTQTQWDEQKAVADEYGLDLIAYEGGQHVHYSVGGLSDEDEAILAEFMEDFVRSPEMAQLYEQLWEAWAEVSDGAFMQFGAIGDPRDSGSWGLRSDQFDENPRAALLDLLNQTGESWWGDGGNDAYQHGVQTVGTDADETIVGTTQEDYLAGGAGDDILIGGEGDDGLNGGDGDDIAVFSGDAEDYSIEAEGDGYRVIGADGSDFVINVETFRFDGDVEVSLQDFLDGNVPPGGTDDIDTISFTGEFIEGVSEVVLENFPDVKTTMVYGVTHDSALGQSLGLSADGEPYEAYFVTPKDGGHLDYKELTQKTMADGHENVIDDMLTGGSIVVDPDIIRGSDGREVFVGASGVNHFEGGGGNDTLRGWAGADTLYGQNGHDIIRGDQGDDMIDGGAGNDTMRGGSGDDTLIGGSGSNLYYGGQDSDTFVVGRGYDQVIDMSADDLLDLTALGLGTDANVADFAATNGDGNLEITNGTETVVLLGLDESDLSWMSMLT